MDIKIKEATTNDFEILILFRLKLLKHDNQIDSKTPYTMGKIQKSISYMKDYLKKKDNKYFLAYHNSLPVGYLHVTHDDKKNKKSSYLSELYVLDLYRNQGVGKRLVWFQWKYLKNRGITENVLTTAKYKNNRTINFYKKLDYDLIKENKKRNIVYFSKKI
jgi:ribosomal protein S18 acetylase RimI-like enzyme